MPLVVVSASIHIIQYQTRNQQKYTTTLMITSADHISVWEFVIYDLRNCQYLNDTLSSDLRFQIFRTLYLVKLSSNMYPAYCVTLSLITKFQNRNQCRIRNREKMLSFLHVTYKWITKVSEKSFRERNCCRRSVSLLLSFIILQNSALILHFHCHAFKEQIIQTEIRHRIYFCKLVIFIWYNFIFVLMGKKNLACACKEIIPSDRKGKLGQRTWS